MEVRLAYDRIHQGHRSISWCQLSAAGFRRSSAELESTQATLATPRFLHCSRIRLMKRSRTTVRRSLRTIKCQPLEAFNVDTGQVAFHSSSTINDDIYLNYNFSILLLPTSCSSDFIGKLLRLSNLRPSSS